MAAEERQNALAVAVLTADRVLAGLDGRPVATSSRAAVAALDVRTARRRAGPMSSYGGQGSAVKGFRRHSAPSTVRLAVRAIADACVPDPDALLRQLLTDVIEDCEALCVSEPSQREAGTSAAASAIERAEV